MITRITRGTLHRNSEARVFELLRTAFEGTPQPAGLRSFTLNRRVTGASTVELVAVTVWDDVEAMETTIGPRWREPSWMPGLEGSIDEQSVEILEAVVFGYERLADAPLSEDA